MTPYEVGIPGREFAEKAFAAIREEAEVRQVDTGDPGAFFQLGEVGRIIREIQGEERGGEVIERFGSFLFHAFHFHRAGERLYLLETQTARDLVERPPESLRWSGSLPTDAGYIQLPLNLFWSQSATEGPAEPLDGIFWARGAAETLTLMVALGIRGDRPGISVVELPPLPLADAAEWVGGGHREGGTDFATTLPGGELDRLYSIVTLGEVLTLCVRVFALLATDPGAVGEERTPKANGGGPAAETTRPSLLPFRRIGAREPETPDKGSAGGAA
jgi:hypothetical protein